MTVAELIQELQCLPQHLPVLCEGSRYEESVSCVSTRNVQGNEVGPIAVIHTVPDERNADYWNPYAHT